MRDRWRMVWGVSPADTDLEMNAYELLDGSGRNLEIEAEFYQRSGEDLLFIAHGEEVMRIVADDVQAIVRVPLRSPPPQPARD